MSQDDDPYYEYVNGILRCLGRNDYGYSEFIGHQDIVATLTSRTFSYLSRTAQRTAVRKFQSYREKQLLLRRPLEFFLNIGGGFRPNVAVLETEESDLSFGELLLLFQIGSFLQIASQQHPFGVNFTLYASDVCSNQIYGIPFDRSRNYVQAIRDLISRYGVRSLRVLRESEYIGDSYSVKWDGTLVGRVEKRDQARIKRYLHNQVSYEEMLEVQSKYAFYTRLAKEVSRERFDGFFLAQRPSDQTHLCFRSFPGGDGKMHSGAIILTLNINGKVVPKLIMNLHATNYTELRGDKWPCRVLGVRLQ